MSADHLAFRGGTASSVADVLRQRYDARFSSPVNELATYYDTFDWRLYRTGSALTSSPRRSGVRVVWSELGGDVLHETRTERPPTVAGEFLPAAFQEAIAPVIKMRRLLPQVVVQRQIEELRVPNESGTHWLRVRIENRGARSIDGRAEQELPPVLLVCPEPGHDCELRAILEAVGSAGWEPESGEPELDEALRTVGRRPADYSSKIDVSLDPGSPAGEATREVLRALLATMEANEHGTRHDLDSEFLHDFRVAVRRTRSALGQVKGVFRRESIETFRAEFSWLGTLTGPTRDLDVFLLKLPEYSEGLVGVAEDDLAPLEGFLQTRQRRAQAEVRLGLESERYRNLIEAWGAFLDSPGAADGARADQPAIELASRCIRRAHGRVLDKGSAIGPESPTAKLHRLRIACKKLRYLLEFFRSLYPADRIDGLIVALKRLQDNLGDFNDYGIHLQVLRASSEQMSAAGLAPPGTYDAIQDIVRRLEVGQAAERRLFTESFAEFTAPATADVFEELFGRPRTTAPGGRP